MFREMRRSSQQLTMEETQNILQKGTSGVLSLLGDEGYPYGVPLSYVYDGEKLYFHCAKTGHKIDAVHRESKASFCVIDQDLIMPQKYTTYFRSAIAFGKVRILESEQKKREAGCEICSRRSSKPPRGHHRSRVGSFMRVGNGNPSFNRKTGKRACRQSGVNT